MTATRPTVGPEPDHATDEDIMGIKSHDDGDSTQRPRAIGLSADAPDTGATDAPDTGATAHPDAGAHAPPDSVLNSDPETEQDIVQDLEEEGAVEATGAAERMPTVWRGRRRWLLSLLLLLGLFQAVMALVMAFTVDGLLGAPAQLNQTVQSGTTAEGTAVDPASVADAGLYVPWDQLLLLAVAVLSLGGARWAERVVAEDLGQDYVYEQRRRLIASALGGAGNPSLGVVITRASNDLSAVRAWISQGLVPLVTAVPLIAVVVAVLAVSNLPVGLAVGAPILVLLLVLPPLAQATFSRARRLRRRRGRMSARISDTVQAGESILAAGGIRRELNALDRDSGKVVGAAVARARLTGLVRALAITAAALSSAGVVVLGALGVVDVAGVASSLTLVGVMAAPMGELGRVVEYRQNYRAARRIQAPLLAAADRLKAAERARERAWEQVPHRPEITGENGLRVARMQVAGQPVPMLSAGAGDRVLIRSIDPGRTQPFLAALLAGQNTAAPHDDTGPGAGDVPALQMVVDGYDYTLAPGRERRRLLGHASIRVPLERGSIGRLVTYRKPDAEDEEMFRALDRVGLLPVVHALPKGTRTRLKNGGRPLNTWQIARLKLGRALLDDPPLLVLDAIDTDLDDDGRELLRRELQHYPGVVLFTFANPELVAPGHRTWTIDTPGGQ